jgi:hypothetical protein
LGSRKYRVFLDKFRKCQLLKNSGPWSYLANPSRCNTQHVLT